MGCQSQSSSSKYDHPQAFTASYYAGTGNRKGYGCTIHELHSSRSSTTGHNSSESAIWDPGYAELNPAYDQPVNTRPVWGIAKPLPRVIRPGMVPTRSELKLQIPTAEAQKQDPANADLERGRVEPTLRLNRISAQLQSLRQERESVIADV